MSIVIKCLVGLVNIEIISLCIGNSQWCLYSTLSKYDWLFNTQSRVLQADLLMLENSEKAALNINMPYSGKVLTPLQIAVIFLFLLCYYSLLLFV